MYSIILARRKKGLTQEELADMAGIGRRTLQRIENGDTEPRAFTLKAIADVLEVTVEELSAPVDPDNDPVFAERDAAAHFLQVFCLSCFSYILVPWFHFLIPLVLLRRQPNLSPKLVSFCRKTLRQQVYWVISLQAALLLTLAYNLIFAKHGKGPELGYLIPVGLFYLINPILILTALRRAIALAR